MKFVDLFCGMGTIRMGFEKAGHECVYSVEWDKHKRRIYEVIFGSEPEGSDITRQRAIDIPTADCWTFGAPCQDFSIAGQRSGLDGDRSSLVREVFRLLRETQEELRPEWILYENVKGMLSSNKGFDFLEILIEMDELGYDFEWEILNTKHFGVPQNRERVFTVGHLRSRGSRKIFPIGEDEELPDGKERAIIKAIGQASSDGSQAGTVYDETGIFPTMCAGTHGYAMGYVRQIGNVMPTSTRDNPNQGRVYDTNGISPCLNKMEGGGRQPMILEPCACLTPGRMEKRQNGRRFKNPGEPMFTLTKQDIHGIKLGDRIRRLTPRECFRLQGVEDSVTGKVFAAGISDTQCYKAAGDATTVDVIYEIAKRMESIALTEHPQHTQEVNKQ